MILHHSRGSKKQEEVVGLAVVALAVEVIEGQIIIEVLVNADRVQF